MVRIDTTRRARSATEREAILAEPVFGESFTDHMVTMTYRDGQWGEMRLGTFGDLTISPAALALHYGQSIFEALKAYAYDDGRIALFRPSANAARMRTTAERIAMPALPQGAFELACGLLAHADRDWVPRADGAALYVRPFMFASEPHLSVRPANEYLFAVIASPVASYFGSGMRAISVAVETHDVRATVGGTGSVKFAGNYAAGFAAHGRAGRSGHDQVLWLDSHEHRWVEELNAMNVMFVWNGSDGPILTTPPLSGTILEGITRDALLTLARSSGFAAVVEEPTSIDGIVEGASDGSLLEMFACGTAAVIAPIGRLTVGGDEVVIGDGEPGPMTMALRRSLFDLQYGRADDPHGWMVAVTDLLDGYGIDPDALTGAGPVTESGPIAESGSTTTPEESPTDSSRVTFSLATDTDVAEVTALVQSAYRGDESRQGWTTEAGFLEGQRVDEDMVREILDEPDPIILLARVDGRLVGCCELRPHEGDDAEADDPGGVAVPSAYLGMFAVDPTIQASGLGRVILGAAEDRVRELWGARRLVIWVIGVRRELIAWYERRGFGLTGGTEPFPYDDERFGVPLRDDLEFVELEKML